jgi:hypothetical protein
MSPSVSSERTAEASPARRLPAAEPRLADVAPRSLLQALVQGSLLPDVVPRTLAILEDSPLASAGCFRGDLLRALMSVPAQFWARNPALHQRYRTVLHDGAALRWSLDPSERDEFWTTLDAGRISGMADRGLD